MVLADVFDKYFELNPLFFKLDRTGLFAHFGEGGIRGERPGGCHIATKVFEVAPNPNQYSGLEKNVHFTPLLNHKTRSFTGKIPQFGKYCPNVFIFKLLFATIETIFAKKNKR